MATLAIMLNLLVVNTIISWSWRFVTVDKAKILLLDLHIPFLGNTDENLVDIGLTQNMEPNFHMPYQCTARGKALPAIHSGEWPLSATSH